MNRRLTIVLIISLIILNTASTPLISLTSKITDDDTRIKHRYIVLPANRIPVLVGKKIEDIKDLVVCSGGGYYIGNIWLLPDKIVETKLYGSIVEIPVLDRDIIKNNDVIILEIPLSEKQSGLKACPWGLDHALSRIHNRIKLTISENSRGEAGTLYNVYVYYDEKSRYDRHMALAPLSLIKKLAREIGISDYHDVKELKMKLLGESIKKYSIDSIHVEKMDKFVFSKDYTRLLNDPITGYSTEEALEICPSCPVMDGGGGTTGYVSELYFYLTSREKGGPVMPPSSDEYNVSKVYLGRGADIEKLTLYIVGRSMDENDESTLLVKLILQENITSDLRGEDAWTNITTKTYYLELGSEPTYTTLEIPKDQLTLEPGQMYRVIIEFQWVYGSQPYLNTAVLGVKKHYDDIVISSLPGNPSATMTISQLRTVGEYFSPSKPNPLMVSTVLKPLSGAVDDTYSLHIDMHVWPDWERTSILAPSIDFTIKIYVNGILRKTLSFTLNYGEDKDLSSIIIPLYRSDFLYRGGVLITYQLERSQADKVYGDFAAKTHLDSVKAFPEVWNTNNPGAYLLSSVPMIQKTVNFEIETLDYNRTILSTFVMIPSTRSQSCQEDTSPIKAYYYIHDGFYVSSWKLTITSNYELFDVSVSSNADLSNEIPYISYMMNALILGFNVVLTYLTAGMSLLPQIIIQLTASTIIDLASFFISKLVSSDDVDVERIDDYTFEVKYNSPLASNRKDLSVIIYITPYDERFNECGLTPAGYIVDISITSEGDFYLENGVSVESYYFIYWSQSDIPGYQEISNLYSQKEYGIRYG